MKRKISTIKEGEEEQEQEKWFLERTKLSTRNDLTCLTKLNLPNCGLSTLPSEMPKILPNLSVMFMPKNNFEELPAIVGECPKLQMVSFKDNGMKRIHPEAMQAQMRWLILTENAIEALPETIGRCKKLQKLMLSGNRLSSLPNSIDQLENLELVRLACNQLKEPPLKLLQLANLRWVAFSNNPFLEGLRALDDNDLTILDDPLLEDDKWPVLGQGAGGVTRKVPWNDGLNAAVKTFSGELTSDGSPQDERAISVTAASLKDSSLIQLFGQTKNGSLVMEFLEGYEALAGPPSLETCSRDVYAPDRKTTTEDFCWQIATNLLRALQSLHQKGICHGDFYGHNILISSSSSSVKLSDFGAAFFYNPKSDYGKLIQTIELRSYTVLVEELQELASSSSSFDNNNNNEKLSKPWADLTSACQQGGATFEDLGKRFMAET